MAFTQADLDAVQRAITRGERTVQYSDRLVVYRSMDELLQAERLITAALTGRPRQVIGFGSKGL